MKCKAYIEGPNLCKNGFPQSDICRGSTCHSCGKYSNKITACQNEDILPMWLKEDGSPKFHCSEIASPKPL